MDASQYLTQGLPALLDLLDGSDVREIRFHDGDVRLRLHRAEPVESNEARGGTVETTGGVERTPAVATITSPLVGTFYRASKPGMPPFVEEGSVITESTIVGIVEVLQVLTEVPAGCRGTIVAAMVTDGQRVQYGQHLFEVEVSD